MTDRPPVLSGAELIRALESFGWKVMRQRGSHVRLRHENGPRFLVVPIHKELKKGTLRSLIRDAGLDPDDLRRVL